MSTDTLKYIDSITQERDQLRELCGDLLQTLRHVEGSVMDISVTRQSIQLGVNKAITKAERVLGGE